MERWQPIYLDIEQFHNMQYTRGTDFQLFPVQLSGLRRAKNVFIITVSAGLDSRTQIPKPRR